MRNTANAMTAATAAITMISTGFMIYTRINENIRCTISVTTHAAAH